jgi:retinol dehydrogenase 13
MRDMDWVLVTGSTSGIGRATTLELLQRRHNVILAARDIGAARRVAQEAASRGHPGATSIQKVDMSDLESIARLVADLNAAGLTLKGVVNNAGVCRAMFALSPNGVEETLAVNTIGPHALSLWCLESGLLARGSKILNVATHILPAKLDRDRILGRAAFSMHGAYMHSKLALLMLASGLSERVSKDACQILSVFPGVVRSKLGRETLLLKMLGVMIDPFIGRPESAAGVICSLYDDEAPQHGMVFDKSKETDYGYSGDKRGDVDWLLDYVETLISSHWNGERAPANVQRTQHA